MASPWVEEATLRRVLPATVEVTIRERRPMAIGRVGQALYLVDGTASSSTSTARPTPISTCRWWTAWAAAGHGAR